MPESQNRPKKGSKNDHFLDPKQVAESTQKYFFGVFLAGAQLGSQSDIFFVWHVTSFLGKMTIFSKANYFWKFLKFFSKINWNVKISVSKLGPFFIKIMEYTDKVYTHWKYPKSQKFPKLQVLIKNDQKWSFFDQNWVKFHHFVYPSSRFSSFWYGFNHEKV